VEKTGKLSEEVLMCLRACTYFSNYIR